MKNKLIYIILLIFISSCCPKFPEKDFTEQNNFILNFLSKGSFRSSSYFLEFYFHTRFAKMNNIKINKAYEAKTVDKVIPTVVSYEYDNGILSKILMFELNDLKNYSQKSQYNLINENGKEKYIIKEIFSYGDSDTITFKIHYCGNRIAAIEPQKESIPPDFYYSDRFIFYQIDFQDTSTFNIIYTRKYDYGSKLIHDRREDEILYKFIDMKLSEIYENASNYHGTEITWDESGYQKKYSIEYDEQYKPKYFKSFYSCKRDVFVGYGSYIKDTTTVFYEWLKDSVKAYELPKDNSGEKKLNEIYLLNEKGLPTKHVEYWHDYDTTYTRITEYEYEYIGEGQQESK